MEIDSGDEKGGGKKKEGEVGVGESMDRRGMLVLGRREGRVEGWRRKGVERGGMEWERKGGGRKEKNAR